MPVLDGDFEAFVTNLGKYNEGMLIGEWVKLPTTEEEMQKVFERIGIGKQDEFGQPYEEWFITDYECPIYGVQKMLGEYENLDKLNYLAALIDELSLSDQEKLVVIMESGCDEVSDIDDLINLTFNLDCYDIMPGINDESDLGYYYAHEAGIYSEKDLGPLANYIDYVRYGRDIAMAIDAVEAAMSGMTEPKYQEVYLGKAQVRNIFKISSVGVVAGSYVLDGKVQRGAKVLVRRKGETVYEGTLTGLKRFKDDAKEVAAGYECGISVDGYNDFMLDDEIEAYIKTDDDAVLI